MVLRVAIIGTSLESSDLSVLSFNPTQAKLISDWIVCRWLKEFKKLLYIDCEVNLVWFIGEQAWINQYSIIFKGARGLFCQLCFLILCLVTFEFLRMIML